MSRRMSGSYFLFCGMHRYRRSMAVWFGDVWRISASGLHLCKKECVGTKRKTQGTYSDMKSMRKAFLGEGLV